jgi:filamentous hemagglutinin
MMADEPDVPQLGGPYALIRAAATRAGFGGEVHHMPAWSATEKAGNTGLTRGTAPSIWMTTDDHASTPSFRNAGTAQRFRAWQEALIRSGSYLDALKMDVDAIRSEFGTRYDGAIQQMGEQFWKARQ